MPAPTGAVTTEQMSFALDQEFVTHFDQDVNQLKDIFGIVDVEVLKAGVTLKQYKVTGSLNASQAEEGEEIPLSQYKEDPIPIGEMVPKTYRKLTTAQAILKSGYEHAVVRTDNKMRKDVRADVLKGFYEYLKNGTGTAEGTNLQSTLANVDAALDIALEDNDDSTDGKVYFVNPLDRAAWLGSHEITGAQTAFGMTYMEGFLGLTGTTVFTSKVPKGTVYATPKENLHLYTLDFGSLGNAGLAYEVSDNGCIGVHHTPAYNRASAETHVMTGTTFLAEATNYIFKGTINGGVASQTLPAAVVDEPEPAAAATPVAQAAAADEAPVAQAAVADEAPVAQAAAAKKAPARKTAKAAAK